jgi:type II secretory pathway pseudopilin PulG
MDCGIRITDCGLTSSTQAGRTGRVGESAIRNPQSAIGGSGGGEKGYTMVMLVMILAVMAIMMTVAVQTASFQMQREREAELIFRGQQYAEAIRLFRLRYGRFPMRLKEIWEADPKVMRKKWKDPITDSYDWGLIFAGQGGQTVGQQKPGKTPVATRTPAFGDRDTEAGTGSPFGDRGSGRGSGNTGRKGRGEMVGPIIGVHSKSCDESIKVYEGRTTYCEWKFQLDVREGRGSAGDGRGSRPPYRGGYRGPTRRGEGSGGSGPGNRPPPPQPTGTPYP